MFGGGGGGSISKSRTVAPTPAPIRFVRFGRTIGVVSLYRVSLYGKRRAFWARPGRAMAANFGEQFRGTPTRGHGLHGNFCKKNC